MLFMIPHLPPIGMIPHKSSLSNDQTGYDMLQAEFIPSIATPNSNF